MTMGTSFILHFSCVCRCTCFASCECTACTRTDLRLSQCPESSSISFTFYSLRQVPQSNPELINMVRLDSLLWGFPSWLSDVRIIDRLLYPPSLYVTSREPCPYAFLASTLTIKQSPQLLVKKFFLTRTFSLTGLLDI